MFFNFSVLSMLNSGDAQKENPSSDSKSHLMAAWSRFIKVVWSCHKHPSGVKSNFVSSAPSSIWKIFSFSISSHFPIQICGGVKGWCNWFRNYFYKFTLKFSQSRWLVTSIETFWFLSFIATQFARQLHQERFKGVCSNKEARKRLARRHSRNGPWT